MNINILPTTIFIKGMHGCIKSSRNLETFPLNCPTKLCHDQKIFSDILYLTWTWKLVSYRNGYPVQSVPASIFTHGQYRSSFEVAVSA